MTTLTKHSEYPVYECLLKVRADLLLMLPKKDRAVYEVKPLDETEVEGKGVEWGTLLPGVTDLDRKMDQLTGNGPWMNYPALNESPGWNYARYKRVVLSSATAAGIPCRHGRMPAWYLASEGSYADLKAVLDLFPDAASVPDMSGAPMLIAAIGSTDSVKKTRLLVSRGADPNGRLPCGLSVFSECVAEGDYRMANELLREGCSVKDDASLPSFFVDQALEEGRLPALLRDYLKAIQRERKAQTPPNPNRMIPAADILGRLDKIPIVASKHSTRYH